MTARADISNHRRRKLEERSQLGTGSYGPRPYGSAPRVVVPSGEHVKALTAWEKGEAKPPFYREVLEEGVRRGDVVSKEQVGRVVFDTTFDERQAVRKLCAELAAERQRALMAEAKLREAEGRIRRARDGLAVLRATGTSPYGLSRRQREAVDEVDSILAGTEKEDAA